MFDRLTMIVADITNMQELIANTPPAVLLSAIATFYTEVGGSVRGEARPSQANLRAGVGWGCSAHVKLGRPSCTQHAGLGWAAGAVGIFHFGAAAGRLRVKRLPASWRARNRDLRRWQRHDASVAARSQSFRLLELHTLTR